MDIWCRCCFVVGLQDDWMSYCTVPHTIIIQGRVYIMISYLLLYTVQFDKFIYKMFKPKVFQSLQLSLFIAANNHCWSNSTSLQQCKLLYCVAVFDDIDERTLSRMKENIYWCIIIYRWPVCPRELSQDLQERSSEQSNCLLFSVPMVHTLSWP